MSNNYNNQKSYEKLNTSLSRLEFVFILFTAVGAALKFMHMQSGSFLLITGLSALALLFLINAFAGKPEYKGRTGWLLHRFGNLGLTFALIGILFRLMIWSGSDQQLIISLALIICSLAGILYLHNQSDFKKSFPLRIFLRLIVIGGLATLIYTVTEEKIMTYYYKSDPEYVRLFFNMKNHPDDSSAKKAFENYRKEKYQPTGK